MKIWFDKDDLSFNKFCSEQFLLLPFFKESVINKDNDFKNNIKWKTNISKQIELTSKQHCDIFVFPEKLNCSIDKYIIEAKKYNKKILAFYNDDNDKPSCLDNNVILYRTSLLKSKQKINEFAMPAWSQDFSDIISFSTRQKSIKPVVSFCGFFSHQLRKQCINILKTNKDIETSFIIRESFWGGDPHNVLIRNEYINNITNSDLVLCIRGAGNFSYRLYEAMSCGRIPIIVNTDCVLPCEDKIDWQDICIFVENIETLNSSINKFWQKLSFAEYIDRQLKIRSTYETLLAPDGFAQYLSYNI